MLRTTNLPHLKKIAYIYDAIINSFLGMASVLRLPKSEVASMFAVS
jgi:hypothetical protein